MNNILHTPAPWYIAHHNDIDGTKSIDIRHCCDIPHSTPQIHQIARLPENAMANAHLISAGPDLLSALEELLKREGETELNSVGVELKTDALEKAICKAKSAIAKAKGAA